MRRQQSLSTSQNHRFFWPVCARVLILITAMVITGLPINAYSYDHKIAVLVGVENYESGVSNKVVFRNLPMVANDLEVMAKALVESGFTVYIRTDAKKPVGSTFDYQPLHGRDESPLTPLRADHVTKLISELPRSIDGLNETSNSLLFVYFTGHGGLLGKRTRALAMPDSKIGHRASFVDVSTILQDMADMAPKTDKILVIDACADKLMPDAKETSIPEGGMPARMYSSESGKQSFVDKYLRRSIFTHYFAEALTHADDLGVGEYNGVIDFDGVLAYVKRKVPKHDAKELKRPLSDKSENQVQTPWGVPGERSPLVLATTKKALSINSPSPGMTGADVEAHRRLLTETYYGGGK